MPYSVNVSVSNVMIIIQFNYSGKMFHYWLLIFQYKSKDLPNSERRSASD